MAVADQIHALSCDSIQIAEAIVSKGGTVGSGCGFDDYAALISALPSGGENWYGVPSMSSFFGSVDASGNFVRSAQCQNLTFGGITRIGDYGMSYLFYNGSSKYIQCRISSVSFPDLTSVGYQGLFYAFGNNTLLSSVSFDSLTDLSSGSEMKCAFNGCPNVAELRFPSLTHISGGSAASNSTFGNNTQIKRMYFPKVEMIVNPYVFSDCNGLKEIHFAVSAETSLTATSGYASKWGASKSTVYFDI